MNKFQMMIYGFLQICEGIIIILTLGNVAASFCMWYITRVEARNRIKQAKGLRE